MKGVLFNIQKFSVHDGPGIRTTLFFKGCPLRCAWCANPESQWFAPQPMRDLSRCMACGRCEAACPRTQGTPCTGCGACVQACPQGALELVGRAYTVDELVRICLQDSDFYTESGGGVTLSGGEPLAQPAFCAALLFALKAQGLHTAVETTGHVEPAVLARLAPMVDLFLYDIKHHDAGRHRAATGVSNERIAGNLRTLLADGRQVLVRIPVIPGINDTLADARAFAALLGGMGIPRVQLLPFHQLGEGKYPRLGRPYALAGAASLHAEALEAYRQAFAPCVNAFF